MILILSVSCQEAKFISNHILGHPYLCSHTSMTSTGSGWNMFQITITKEFVGYPPVLDYAMKLPVQKVEIILHWGCPVRT